MIFLACASSSETVPPPSNEILAETSGTALDSNAVESTPEDILDPEEERRIQLTELYKEELTDQYHAEANGLVNFYISAQQRFFAGDYQNALNLINKAAEIKENADVLALKGSIYLGLGQTQNFVSSWRQALEMDPDVPIPPLPYVVQQLQLNGLLDENLKKAF